MSKLHELLAIDSSCKSQSEKCRKDLQATFTGKRHHFEEKLVTFTPLVEGAPSETREQSSIQTTVRKEIEWVNNILVKSLDASYAIDVANTHAKADIILEDDSVVMKAVPATSLLQMAKRVTEIRELIAAIPTLEPAKGFKPDATREPGIYVAREVTKNSTQKIEEFITASPATKEHPAQVAKVSRDVKTGTILEQAWSSMITPAMKSDLLDRAEMLGRAIAKARARANEQEIDTRTHKIGRTLLDYIFEPLSV